MFPKYFLIIQIIGQLIVITSGARANLVAINLDDNTEKVLVENNMLVYVDKNGNLPLTDVLNISENRWIPVSRQMTIPRQWLKPGDKVYEKILINNQSQYQMVVSKTGMMARDFGPIKVFWFQNGLATEIPTAGEYLLFFLREKGNGYLLTVREIKRSYSTAHLEPWAISSMTKFLPTTLSWNRWNFVAIGVGIAILFYNIGMFFFYRRHYFFYYCGYLAASITFIAYIQDTISGYQSFLLFLPGCLALLFLFLFKSSSLNLKKYTPRLYWIYLIATLVTIGYTIGTNITGFSHPLNIGLWLIAFLLAFVTSLVRATQGFQPAKLMVIGWGFQSLGYLILILNYAYLKSQESIFLYTPALGWSLEIIFFSFAAGYKVSLQEKSVIAQNSHAFSQLRKVFYPHQIRAIRQGSHIEGTLPVGSGEACVIAFDVIGSSKVKHAGFRDVLETFFSKCRLIMLQNYDDEKLTANAFMIKEMGDGFLCSIGFPFKPPITEKADMALKLSRLFIREFNNVMIEADVGHKVYCAAGIAWGEVEGMFSTGNTVRYDIFGHTVVLATRYESMRKAIFKKFELPINNIIVIHQEVMDRLSPNQRLLFIEIDLEKEKMQVRDDPDARRCYFATIEPQQMNSEYSGIISLKSS